MTDSTDYAIRVGERLRMVRELAGLSLDDIQAKTGGRWSDSTIGSWERGERHPFVQVLAEYAGFLGVPVLALLPDSPAADAALARFGADVTRRRMRELSRALEGAPA